MPEILNQEGLSSRDEAISAFQEEMTDLERRIADAQEFPSVGPRATADDLMKARHERREILDNGEPRLEALREGWRQLGGEEVDAAQAAVDALNFRSDALDHVAAKTRLRDAKNAFYANLQESMQPEAKSSEPGTGVEQSSTTEGTTTEKETSTSETTKVEVSTDSDENQEDAQKSEAEKEGGNTSSSEAKEGASSEQDAGERVDVVAGDEEFAQPANDGESYDEYVARLNTVANGEEQSADTNTPNAAELARRAEVIDDLSDLQTANTHTPSPESHRVEVANFDEVMDALAAPKQNEKISYRDMILHPLAYLSTRLADREKRLRDAANEKRVNGDEERYKKRQRLLLGVTVGVAALAAAYIFRDQIGDAVTNLSGGGGGDHANTVGTTIGQQGSIHDLDKFRNGHAGPSIITGGEIPVPQLHTPEANLYANSDPWQWASDAFGRVNATPELHHLTDLAQAQGHVVEWLPARGGGEYIKIDGNSNTEAVLNILRPLAG